jgi:hypothetical protein
VFGRDGGKGRGGGEDDKARDRKTHSDLANERNEDHGILFGEGKDNQLVRGEGRRKEGKRVGRRKRETDARQSLQSISWNADKYQ